LGARSQELEDQPILLCDGPDCGREYHLSCCVPPLSAVPDMEVWLCRDCCPDGSTASLIEYLEAADKAKADYLSEQDSNSDFVRHLVQRDSSELVKPTTRIPESELSRSAMIHALALCEPNHLARTRGGSERREALPCMSHVGKPIRLFNPLGNTYHTGRIVEIRSRAKETEFLVRFSAGKDDRKKPYQHWIVLEEHALAVGTTIVWAKLPAGNWKPAILWLRTCRELIPVQDQLKESEGEIIYEGEKHSYLGSPSKTKHIVSALARSFGDEVFAIINVRDKSVDLNDPVSTKAYLKDPENVVQYRMAQAELAEQERVRSWSGLEQVDPMGPSVLSSVDYYTLRPLIPTGSRLLTNERPHAALCPNIRLGLDRSKICQMLVRRGIQPTKDMAASLVCELIPVNGQTMEAERFGRTSHQ
jgi:hypothetical protein